MFYREINKPDDIPNNLKVFHYPIIKKYQKSSFFYEFASILYISIIAEIFFLFFSILSTESTNKYVKAFCDRFVFLSIDTVRLIVYIPIAITLAMIIWRAKNYLLNETSLDIDTKLERFLYILIPIIFAFLIYLTFNEKNLFNWVAYCAIYFFVCSFITLRKINTLRKDNKFRIKIPYRNNIPYVQNINIYGYRRQISRWAILLVFESLLVLCSGILLIILDIYLFELGMYWLIILLNYVAGAIISLTIYYMTTLSKSVRPVSIEAYEKEFNLVIENMSVNKENFEEGDRFWPLLVIQYRALEYLRQKDVGDHLLQWKSKMDDLLNVD